MAEVAIQRQCLTAFCTIDCRFRVAWRCRCVINRCVVGRFVILLARDNHYNHNHWSDNHYTYNHNHIHWTHWWFCDAVRSGFRFVVHPCWWRADHRRCGWYAGIWDRTRTLGTWQNYNRCLCQWGRNEYCGLCVFILYESGRSLCSRQRQPAWALGILSLR